MMRAYHFLARWFNSKPSLDDGNLREQLAANAFKLCAQLITDCFSQFLHNSLLPASAFLLRRGGRAVPPVAFFVARFRVFGFASAARLATISGAGSGSGTPKA
jgi:hypothetical protein